jgi:hypothetical protein
MFVDACAIVAVLTGEPEADALEGDTLPIGIFEAGSVGNGMRASRRLSRTSVNSSS